MSEPPRYPGERYGRGPPPPMLDRRRSDYPGGNGPPPPYPPAGGPPPNMPPPRDGRDRDFYRPQPSRDYHHRPSLLANHRANSYAGSGLPPPNYENRRASSYDGPLPPPSGGRSSYPPPPGDYREDFGRPPRDYHQERAARIPPLGPPYGANDYPRERVHSPVDHRRPPPPSILSTGGGYGESRLGSRKSYSGASPMPHSASSSSSMQGGRYYPPGMSEDGPSRYHPGAYSSELYRKDYPQGRFPAGSAPPDYFGKRPPPGRSANEFGHGQGRPTGGPSSSSSSYYRESPEVKRPRLMGSYDRRSHEESSSSEYQVSPRSPILSGPSVSSPLRNKPITKSQEDGGKPKVRAFVPPPDEEEDDVEEEEEGEGEQVVIEEEEEEEIEVMEEQEGKEDQEKGTTSAEPHLEKLTKATIAMKMDKLDDEITKYEEMLEGMRKKTKEELDVVAEKKKARATEPKSTKPASKPRVAIAKARVFSEQDAQDVVQRIIRENQAKIKKATADANPGRLGVPEDLIGIVVPLYRELSDLPFYQEEIDKFKTFKPILMRHLSERKVQELEKSRHLHEQYLDMEQQWLVRVTKFENHHRKKQAALEMKLANRSTSSRSLPSSTNDLPVPYAPTGYPNPEDEFRYVKTLAVVPPMFLDETFREGVKFFDYNGQFEDSTHSIRSWNQINSWTNEEKQVFLQKYLEFPKEFGQIASYLPNKSAQDCVLFYYLNKKPLKMRSLTKQALALRTRRRRKAAAEELQGKQTSQPRNAGASSNTGSRKSIGNESDMELSAPSPPLVTSGPQKPAPRRAVEIPREEENWKTEEVARAKEGFLLHGKDFFETARFVGTKTILQCRRLYIEYKRRHGIDLVNPPEPIPSPPREPPKPVSKPQKVTIKLTTPSGSGEKETAAGKEPKETKEKEKPAKEPKEIKEKEKPAKEPKETKEKEKPAKERKSSGKAPVLATLPPPVPPPAPSPIPMLSAVVETPVPVPAVDASNPESATTSTSAPAPAAIDPPFASEGLVAAAMDPGTATTSGMPPPPPVPADAPPVKKKRGRPPRIDKERKPDVDPAVAEEREKRRSASYWTTEEKVAFLQHYHVYGRNWKSIGEHITTKSEIQIRNYFQNNKFTLGLAQKKVKPNVAANSATSAIPFSSPSKHGDGDADMGNGQQALASDAESAAPKGDQNGQSSTGANYLVLPNVPFPVQLPAGQPIPEGAIRLDMTKWIANGNGSNPVGNNGPGFPYPFPIPPSHSSPASASAPNSSAPISVTTTVSGSAKETAMAAFSKQNTSGTSTRTPLVPPKSPPKVIAPAPVRLQPLLLKVPSASTSHGGASVTAGVPPEILPVSSENGSMEESGSVDSASAVVAQSFTSAPETGVSSELAPSVPLVDPVAVPAASVAVPMVPVKRGRGRPRKDPNAPPKPPKSASTSVVPSTSAAVPTAPVTTTVTPIEAAPRPARSKSPAKSTPVEVPEKIKKEES